MKNNAIILTNGYLNTSDAKTAHGLIRGTDRFSIIGVIDNEQNQGKDAGVLLDGKHRNIPMFKSLDLALSQLEDVHYLIIGIATIGGKLPPSMLKIIEEAISSGLSIVNGLHAYLNEISTLVTLAKENNVELIDIRKPKNREQLSFWSGKIYNVTAPIVAVVGMDCAMGKRTTARLLTQECNANHIKAEMIYTGQTGWLQGGKYGFIFDSTLNDFVSGELENAIVQCWNDTQPDIIFLEGQSSLRNPSGPCGIEFFISGNAKYTILMFAPKRKHFDDDPKWGEIPTVESEIEIIEKLGSKVIAIGINTEHCTNEEAFSYQKEYKEKLKLPVLLPIQEGVSKLTPVLNHYIAEHK
jgi:uncharacterized NAD-dependent epimerase/dehydratase family protein